MLENSVTGPVYSTGALTSAWLQLPNMKTVPKNTIRNLAQNSDRAAVLVKLSSDEPLFVIERNTKKDSVITFFKYSVLRVAASAITEANINC